MQRIRIINKSNNDVSPLLSNYCDSFFCKLIGLMGKKCIAQNESITFSNSKESILESSIHMLFMRFDITVLWIDSEFKIVDKTRAKKWGLLYTPKVKAKYTVETHIDRYLDFSSGDQLVFESIIA